MGSSPRVEFRDDAGKMNGAEFLRGVVEAFPYAIHTVLTDNGMAFADLPKNRNGPSRRYLGAHIFDRVCNCHAWTTTPDLFNLNPRHLIPGPNTSIIPRRGAGTGPDRAPACACW